MKLRTKITNAFDSVISSLFSLGAVTIVFLMFLVITQVTVRNFGVEMIWAFEVSEYSLLWITFLATAWVLKREGHVKMDLVLNRLNPKAEALLNVITSIIGLLICLTYTWYGIKIALSLFESGYTLYTEIDPPLWPIISIVPIGGFLLSIQFLRRGHENLSRWRTMGNKE